MSIWMIVISILKVNVLELESIKLRMQYMNMNAAYKTSVKTIKQYNIEKSREPLSLMG